MVESHHTKSLKLNNKKDRVTQSYIYNLKVPEPFWRTENCCNKPGVSTMLSIQGFFCFSFCCCYLSLTHRNMFYQGSQVATLGWDSGKWFALFFQPSISKFLRLIPSFAVGCLQEQLLQSQLHFLELAFWCKFRVTLTCSHSLIAFSSTPSPFLCDKHDKLLGTPQLPYLGRFHRQ